MKNRAFALLIIVVMISGCTFVSILPFGKAQASSTVVSNQTIEGVYTNPVKIEFLGNATSSSPIVVLVSGFGKNYSEYATFQHDLANQGYVTISFSETHFMSSTDLTTTKHNLPRDASYDNKDIVAVLNWIDNNSLAAGDKQNIVLVARSTGGCAALIYNYPNYGIKGVCALSPAFNFSSVANNLFPVFIVTAQGDTNYQPHSVQYYHELAAPKAYLELNNGTHDLGIVDGDEGILPNSYTRITEKYVFAFLSYATQNSQEGYNIINSANSDSNILESQNLLINPSSFITPTPTILELPFSMVFLLLVATTTIAAVLIGRRKLRVNKVE